MPDTARLIPPGAARDPETIQALWKAFLGGRKPGGRLVGKGVMLKLPVALHVEPLGTGEFKITLEDPDGETCEFNALALAGSKYRKQVEFIVDAGKGRISFRGFAHMAPLHADILESVEPGSCITKNEFDALTARLRRKGSRTQTDGSRRWRELRREYGFDVDVEGESYCRRSRVPVREPRVRPDTSKLTKEKLPELVEAGAALECAKCGTPVKFEKYGLGDSPVAVDGVLDHRRPVAYGGGDDTSNLQILCVRCNNLKRNYCEHCQLEYACERCSWAYPEKINDLLVVALSPAEAEAFEKLVERYKGKPPEVAKQLLMESLERHLRKS